MPSVPVHNRRRHDEHDHDRQHAEGCDGGTARAAVLAAVRCEQPPRSQGHCNIAADGRDGDGTLTGCHDDKKVVENSYQVPTGTVQMLVTATVGDITRTVPISVTISE